MEGEKIGGVHILYPFDLTRRSVFYSVSVKVNPQKMSLYILEVPATKEMIATLTLRILHEVQDLNEQVELRFGRCRLRAQNEREQAEHPNTVSAREALQTLTLAMLPDRSESQEAGGENPRDSA